MRRLILLAAVVAATATGFVRAEDLIYKDQLLASLIKQVPDILKTYDAKTGRFGSGIWICRDQDIMYSLSVAYAAKLGDNKYYRNPQLLETIMKAGDALIADADDKGQWVFRKKDGSTWGNIWMPWTYSRWVRTFSLIKDDMPAARRAKWEKALILGYTGISKSQLGRVHNIPSHHAMGLYVAGKTLKRPEWCELAADFMQKVVADQSEGGYWAEGGGPVVEYNFVYVEALGIYFALSGDERVLPALRRAAEYHWHFTYPDGRSVETIDQRNPYGTTIRPGNVGFTATPEGRAYLKGQWDRLGLDGFKPDAIAALVHLGKEGPIAETPGGGAMQSFVLSEEGQGKAATLRQGPWFICLSAYTTPIATNRWHQDRQNMFSVFHDRVGLVIGGGNTKLQPAWSTFTVGDESLLKHKPGDENPTFVPPAGKLFHVPGAAKLIREPACGLDLSYGAETCAVRVQPKDDRTLVCRLSATANSGLPVAAHVTLLPHMKGMLETGGGKRVELGEEPLHLSAKQVGGSITHAGWRLKVPSSATLLWPALPHNPYRKDGRTEAGEGRLSVRIPLDARHRECDVLLEIVK